LKDVAVQSHMVMDTTDRTDLGAVIINVTLKTSVGEGNS
jgi:hypothetical protein